MASLTRAGYLLQSNTNARGAAAAGGTEGGEEWQPGKLKRADSAASKVGTEEDVDLAVSPRAWSTMTSVLLGTWERRPVLSSAKDRNKMLGNSAAFVRACYPAQVKYPYRQSYCFFRKKIAIFVTVLDYLQRWMWLSVSC